MTQTISRLGKLLILMAASVPLSGAQAAAPWRDPSPHQIRLVTVDSSVHLEVLDWGGSGRPVVLLAGYVTAHVYDDFAPKLTDRFHVYGITRRGYGASDSPAGGYAAQRSADDVLEVLDSLKLQKPILVGNSFGGQDLSTLGAQHSDRLGGLVYLDSAEDPTLGLADYLADYKGPPVDLAHLPVLTRPEPEEDFSSFQAYRTAQLRNHGVAFPEAELRQTFVANADGSMGRYLPRQSVRDAIFAGRIKPAYARIRVPVLAMYRTQPSFEAVERAFSPRNDQERLALSQKYAGNRAMLSRWQRDLLTGVPGARIVELPGANLYMFISNEADVLRELRAFAAGLP